jgi:purine-binding chemotaxis protein CheW
MSNRFLLAFEVAGQHYGLSLTRVQEVIRVVEITPLPKSPDIVLGVINVQGKVVAVVDIRKRFGLPGKIDFGLTDQIIIANTRKRAVALVVDSVAGVIERSAAEIIEIEDIVPGVEYVDGVTKLDDNILFIHDLDCLLSLEEERQLDNCETQGREEI